MGNTRSGIDRETLERLIREGFGGRPGGLGGGGDTASGVYDPGNARAAYTPEPDMVDDFVKQGGGDARGTAYRVGSNEELEQRLARDWEWDGKGDMYEFLTAASYDPDRRPEMQIQWVPGQDIMATSLLGLVNRKRGQ